MRLIIVRHGQTEANVKGILQGSIDYGLNEVGQEQARRIAERLKDEKIDVAYSSDLSRAFDTAVEILKFHPEVKIEVSRLVREKAAGDMEGLQRQANRDLTNFHSHKPKGGESFLEVQERINRFYEEILEKHFGETVLLVSHGGTIGSLFLHLMGLDFVWENYDKYRPQNTGLSIIEVDENKLHKVTLLNCREHLKDIDIKTKGNL